MLRKAILFKLRNTILERKNRIS